MHATSNVICLGTVGGWGSKWLPRMVKQKRVCQGKLLNTLGEKLRFPQMPLKLTPLPLIGSCAEEILPVLFGSCVALHKRDIFDSSYVFS